MDKKIVMWAGLGIAVVSCLILIALCVLYLATRNSLFATLCLISGACEVVGIIMFIRAAPE